MANHAPSAPSVPAITLVETDDRALRRECRTVVFLAYLTAPSNPPASLLLTAVATITAVVTRQVAMGWSVLVFAAVCFVVVVPIYAATIALVVARSGKSARRRDRALYFYRTSDAVAFIAIQPDKRIGQYPGDVLAFGLASRPKGVKATGGASAARPLALALRTWFTRRADG